MRTGDHDEPERFALEWRAIVGKVLDCDLVLGSGEEWYRWADL